MNAAVGIALLSNARVTPSWHTVESFPLIASGLGPINASIATDPGTSPLAFWSWIYSLLYTPSSVIPMSPTRCSVGNDCQSFYLPGTIYNIVPPAASFTDHPEATILILENSIGYQLEFYPPSNTDTLGDAECQTFGAYGASLHICIKQSGNDLLSGKLPLWCRNVDRLRICDL